MEDEDLFPSLFYIKVGLGSCDHACRVLMGATMF